VVAWLLAFKNHGTFLCTINLISGVEFGDSLFDAKNNQLVRPGKRSHFTYPWLCEQYPMKEDLKEGPSLVLAVVNQTAPGIS